MWVLNKLERYKGTQQSQFRVHFYLRNIPYNTKLKPDTFIQNISKQIAESSQVSIMQVSSSIKTQVDLSVALISDHIACQFIDSGKKIFLSVQNDTIVQIQPRIGDAFRSYYLNWKNKSKKMNQGDDIRDMKRISRDSQQLQDYRKRYKTSTNQDHKRRQIQQPSRIKYLWILCIPLQFKERQVCSVLSDYKINIKSYSWRSQQDMQFLQVELHQPLPFKQVQKLDIKIDKYPLLAIAKPFQLSIYQVLIDYEVQLSFDKQIDEIELIRFVTVEEGVICMIKDQFHGPRKYVVAFNTILKANRITERAQKQFKYCHVGKPTFILRLGRLQKNFTFTQTIQNLQIYQAQDFKRQIN